MYDYEPFRLVPRQNDLEERPYWPNLFQHFLDANSFGFNVDVKELEDSFVVEAELPGIDRKNIDVELDDQTVTINVVSYDEKEEQGDHSYIRRERKQGRFRRSFHLHDIDPERASAEYKDGILTIRLPKLETARQKRRTIDIH